MVSLNRNSSRRLNDTFAWIMFDIVMGNMASGCLSKLNMASDVKAVSASRMLSSDEKRKIEKETNETRNGEIIQLKLCIELRNEMYLRITSSAARIFDTRLS